MGIGTYRMEVPVFMVALAPGSDIISQHTRAAIYSYAGAKRSLDWNMSLCPYLNG